MGSTLFNSRLSFSLLTKILLISGIITALLTITQLFFTFQERQATLALFLTELNEAHNPSISYSLYDFNYLNTKKIIKGILTYDAVSYVSIKNNEDRIIKGLAVGKSSPSKGSFVTAFPAIFDADGRKLKLGMVEIHTDAEYLYKQLESNFYVILGTQAIKTFIVSLVLLALFYQLIIRRVTTIHQWLLSYSPEQKFKPIEFPSPKNKLDEIDELKNEINIVGESLHRHNQKLESLVKQRTKELEEANLKLGQLAYTDHLTGIDNRMAFFDKSEKELSRSRRLNYDVGVMMLDLDHFKSINDNFGHEAGDKVLKLITSAISDCLREEDSFGRLGGEEFAIIVPGADKLGMQKLAERIQGTISQEDFSFLQCNRKVTVSIGYTKVTNGERLKTALGRADGHLYSAKANGRNCYVTDEEFIPQIVN